MALQQALKRFRPQERDITIEHQQFAAETGQGLQELLYGVARAVLRLLQHEFKRR